MEDSLDNVILKSISKKKKQQQDMIEKHNARKNKILLEGRWDIQ